jgi:hypothetical protein
MRDTLYVSGTDGARAVPWLRRRVRELPSVRGDQATDASTCDEKFLEDVISAHPELLDLSSSDNLSDIDRPYMAFRQRALRALNGRTIYPDVILVSQTGHVAVIEVKLVDNPELRDRQVLAQVLEYAAVLSECSEADLVQLLGGDVRSMKWSQLVKSWFPEASDPERLALRLLKRFQDRELHLVIACDEAPPGLRELVRAVIGQAAIGRFMFRVVEICPYTANGQPHIAWRTNTVCQTEILQRIEIAISTTTESSKPSVNVNVTSLDEAQSRAKEVEEEVSGTAWSEPSFFADLQRRLDDAKARDVRNAYDEIVRAGYQVKWNKNAKTGSFAVMFPIETAKPSIYIDANGSLWLQFINLAPATAAEAREGLLQIPGMTFDRSKQYTSIPIEVWGPRFMAIKSVFESLSGSSTRD